jgi:hypothetical protein
MSKNRLESKLLLCAAAFGALSASGCATEPAGHDNVESEADVSALQAPATQPATIPSPEGSYFASVVANGTGCPAGTTNTSISADGQVFTITFSAYEVKINETVPDPQITKNCQLAIKLHSPNGLSYSVNSFFYSGYAYLDQGVQASQWARYYFQGNPVPPTNSNRVTLTGPVDKDFIFKDEVKTEDTVWSACGTDRDLNIYTQLQVKNSTPKRSGSANLTAIDGSTKLELRLSWKGCNGAPVAPPIVPDAGARRTGR